MMAGEFSITCLDRVPLLVQKKALTSECPASSDCQDDNVVIEVAGKVGVGHWKVLRKGESVIPRPIVWLYRRWHV